VTHVCTITQGSGCSRPLVIIIIMLPIKQAVSDIKTVLSRRSTLHLPVAGRGARVVRTMDCVTLQQHMQLAWHALPSLKECDALTSMSSYNV
jgi:hypothetical protein